MLDGDLAILEIHYCTFQLHGILRWVGGLPSLLKCFLLFFHLGF